jgi:hypothetical protein
MHQRFAPLHFLGFAALVALVPSDTADARRTNEPMRFFDGSTEMVSVVKVIMKKPYRSRTIGQGQILPDGTLSLVQQVHDAGKPAQRRHWRIKQTDGDSFRGTMSEAIGPVHVDEINDDFRFKFKLKGNLSVEQWVTPLADGKSARTRMTVRKMGMRVATSEGVIRKI